MLTLIKSVIHAIHYLLPIFSVYATPIDYVSTLSFAVYRAFEDDVSSWVISSSQTRMHDQYLPWTFLVVKIFVVQYDTFMFAKRCPCRSCPILKFNIGTFWKRCAELSAKKSMDLLFFQYRNEFYQQFQWHGLMYLRPVDYISRFVFLYHSVIIQSSSSREVIRWFSV